jgi:hypothetical protein
MTDAEREWTGIVAQFQELGRRMREEPSRREPVLPADLDVDAELDRWLAQLGQGAPVSMV